MIPAPGMTPATEKPEKKDAAAAQIKVSSVSSDKPGLNAKRGSAEAPAKKAPAKKARTTPAAADKKAVEPENVPMPAQPAQPVSKKPSTKRPTGGKAAPGAEAVVAEPSAIKSKPAKKARKAASQQEPPPASSAPAQEAEEDVPSEGAQPSGKRRAAADRVTTYKEQTSRAKPSDYVVVKSEAEVVDEATALAETGGNSVGVRRRLTDFALVDEANQPVPVERALLLATEVSLTGVVHPIEGSLAKEQGRRVAAAFGPVKEWRVVYTKAGTSVLIKTAAALYEVQRPASTYRKVHAQFDEQLKLAHQVYLILSPDAGGSITFSYEEVVAKLVRAKVGAAFGGPKEALLLNARFLMVQLAAMGGVDTRGKGTDFLATPFAKALEAELAKGPYRFSAMTDGAIRILDTSAPAQQGTRDAAADALAAADAEMAARMQAKMDAEAAGVGARGGRKPMVAPYIRISEQEIADDYPLPKQYEKEVEETDELLLADPDELAMGCDPEYLPHRQLSDFAFYNSEGFMASLELVPMWTGVDHDVEVFGSGVVAEDEGDFTEAAGGAPSAAAPAEGSSAGGATAQAETPAQGGMRLYLSQIREWVVECSADMLYIVIRTDVAWYRLIKPAEQYVPWFSTVLKAAHTAVAVLGLLIEETRASRLSFSDVIRTLVELPENAPGFVSKKLQRMERFVVVHGQIILNQFKHFPNKAVQRAAFVGELRSRMEQRKHHKLYQAKTKAGKQAVSKSQTANPMRNRAAVGLKAKPMAATATSMVKYVWKSYFFGGMAARAAQAAENKEAVENAPVAREVEDADDEEENDVAVEESLAPAKPVRAKKKAGGAPCQLSAGRDADLTKVTWDGAALKTDSAGRVLYSAAKAVLASGTVRVALNDVVLLREEAEEEGEEPVLHPVTGQPPEPTLGLVTCLYTEGKSKIPMMQVRQLLRGYETMLGDVASDAEVFVTEECWVRPASDIAGLASVIRQQRPWDWSMRVAHFKADEEMRAKNDAALAAGQSIEYFYRALYCPDKGMFSCIPSSVLPATGTFVEEAASPVELGLLPNGKPGFIKDGVEYSPGDFIYLHPQTFAAGQDLKAKGKAKSKGGKKRKADEDDEEEGSEGSAESEGEEEAAKPAPKQPARRLGKAVAEISAAAASSKAAAKQTGKAAGKAKSKAAGKKEEAKEESPAPVLDEVAADPELPDYLKKGKGRWKGSNAGLKPFVVVQLLSVSKVESKEPQRLAVRRLYRPEDISQDLAYKAGWWDLYAGPVEEATQVDIENVVGKAAAVLMAGGPGQKIGDIGTALDTFCVVGSYNPANPQKPGLPPASLTVPGARKAAKSAEEDNDDEEEGAKVAMASLDIFAGCGGLSEGMHQAGVAECKWAIEYEPAAADAFQLNNPTSKVFANNCNVLLRAAMAKANLLDDCDACDDCMEACAKLPAEYTADLPVPGDVEFIMGGPPCQGYSGMNRFNKSNWSLVQNSMVMSYLSYADFYRPRYFLLENVRNFVSHNKSFTFRLTIRTLLEMGYQVRFGVLNAGNFGVPQSRKRTIIWAAAPGEQLPAWPKPRHVFHSPQLTINLPGGVAYTAVPTQPGGGAALRAVTVKDAIADLPNIGNGFSQDQQPYTGAAMSAFQKSIRGTTTVLHDHICKEMNDLNLERCKCIPVGKTGADWRELLEIVKKDPSREMFKGQPLVPWCLPNTMDRHNGWRGLFGRLDLNGHFPTSTTDPQPMGKVGQVFHPTQDRIVSVRECARSQGFPDAFKFSGNVHNKHRQVGNAVPPPLAFALGSQLHVVLDAKRKADVAAAFAQLG